jgi:hypothetical protein
MAFVGPDGRVADVDASGDGLMVAWYGMGIVEAVADPLGSDKGPWEILGEGRMWERGCKTMKFASKKRN